MAEEENALALFLKEYSCAQLFAFLLIKHGCTSLIDHGKLIHTLLYLCKDVYGRVDKKELYNRFFKEMDTCDDYHLIRPRCDDPLSYMIKQESLISVSYRMLRENGKPDGLCELKFRRETRKITFRNGIKVDANIQRNIRDAAQRQITEYHKNGIKARRDSLYTNFRTVTHWDSWGNIQCIHRAVSPQTKLQLYKEYNYDYTCSPPLFKNYVEYYPKNRDVYRVYTTPDNNK